MPFASAAAPASSPVLGLSCAPNPGLRHSSPNPSSHALSPSRTLPPADAPPQPHAHPPLPFSNRSTSLSSDLEPLSSPRIQAPRANCAATDRAHLRDPDDPPQPPPPCRTPTSASGTYATSSLRATPRAHSQRRYTHTGLTPTRLNRPGLSSPDPPIPRAHQRNSHAPACTPCADSDRSPGKTTPASTSSPPRSRPCAASRSTSTTTRATSECWTTR